MRQSLIQPILRKDKNIRKYIFHHWSEKFYQLKVNFLLISPIVKEPSISIFFHLRFRRFFFSNRNLPSGWTFGLDHAGGGRSLPIPCSTGKYLATIYLGLYCKTMIISVIKLVFIVWLLRVYWIRCRCEVINIEYCTPCLSYINNIIL